MHIHEFADHCTFSEIGIGGTLAATEEYRALLKKLHPKQLLNARLSIPLYRVSYGYETRRGNFRQGEKFYFSLNGEHEDLWMEIEMKLEDWVREENERRPYRAISNVNILDITRIAYLNDFNGTVWFLYNGEWTRTKVHYDRESNMAHF